MKKYVVKYKDGGKVYGEYSSRKEASDKLIEHINNFNKYFEGEDLSPFDFVLEVVECGDVNEVITDFETARKVLGIKPLEGIIVSKRLEGVERLVRELNTKHIEAFVALNELFTIADAWNKADGFVPDFSDWEQKKYAPWFNYDKDANRFVCVDTCVTYAQAYIAIGHRLCFKTSERAKQFGKQFAELYNKVFL